MMADFQWYPVLMLIALAVVMLVFVDGMRRVLNYLHAKEGMGAEGMTRGRDATERVSKLLQPLAETWSPEHESAVTVSHLDKAGYVGSAWSPEPEEDISAPIPSFIAFYVMAENHQSFDGPTLLQSLLSLGLKFGDKNIFHFLDHQTQRPLFSLASAFEPGTFNMDQIGSFKTKGIILFMTLPGPDEPLKSFELMLEVGKKLVILLNGILCDGDHLILSVDKVLEYRGHIQRLERRMKMGSADDLHQG